MKRRRHYLLDVFTDAPLAGNPLAVVLESEGLAPERMQAIAREFNLSETVFVLAPQEPRHRALLRIFTPAAELAFAGHPIIGSAALFALLDESDAEAFGLETAAGLASCAVTRLDERTGYARFRAPCNPRNVSGAPNSSQAAAALGLAPGDLEPGRHAIARYGSGGSDFVFIPVTGLDALAKAKPGGDFASVFGNACAYVYAEAAAGDQADWRARMFAPHLGIPEDPATGSAAVAFAGALMEHAALDEGANDLVILQGVEMGRPSRIALQIVIEEGKLGHIEIGGKAVLVSEGALRL